MKLPLKLRIFQYLTQVDHPGTSQDVMDALKGEYAGEGQMTYERVDFYMQSLLCVDMIEQTDVEFDKDGELIVHYQITDFGRSRIKYIPKR